ncbi:NAC transcription factor [Melia azedarach]|uniref:NAC transcription factor n=1 Tax=Melia azedarach TaxID=155640 RepID=A0ACC1YI38_MELAZ|nr:NAC transcription factor [Melia azedarach]
MQEWRLCKIKYKGKPSAQEEQENIRKASSQPAQDLQQISQANFPHPCDGESQQTQLYSSQVSNMCGNEPHNLAELDLKMETIENEQQQQIAFYDPLYDHFDDDQLKQFADSSELLFPNIWSWHVDQDGV